MDRPGQRTGLRVLRQRAGRARPSLQQRRHAWGAAGLLTRFFLNSRITVDTYWSVSEIGVRDLTLIHPLLSLGAWGTWGARPSRVAVSDPGVVARASASPVLRSRPDN